MKKLGFLVFCTVLLASCGQETTLPVAPVKTEVPTPVVEVKHDLIIESANINSDNIQKKFEEVTIKTEAVTQGTDDIFHNEKGFVIYNAKNCKPNEILYNGMYNWTDEEAKEAGCFDKSHYKIEFGNVAHGKEISCFDEINHELTCGGYTADQFGTYFHDKTGGSYNLIRISKKIDGKLKKITGVPESEGSYGTAISIGGEVFYGPSKLKGATSSQELKKLSDENSYYFIFTNGDKVWQERTEIEGANAPTFKVLSNTGMLYTDKNSCYIGLPAYSYIKLEKCNPTAVKVNTDKQKFIDKNDETFEFTDGTHVWGQYGEIIK